jgi:hypothetical protein
MIRWLAWLLVAALLALPARAVTITGTPVSAGATNQASPLTVSYTVPSSGGNRCLFAHVMAFDGTGTITGVTYNSVALTFVEGVGAIATDGRIELWRLVDPSTGSNTVSVAFSATMDEAWVQVFSAEDCDQTTPVGTRTTLAWGTRTTSTLPSLSLDANEIGLGGIYISPGGVTLTESDTLVIEVDAGGTSGRAIQQGNADLSWTHSSTLTVAIGYPINHQAAANLEQEGFRWGVDDGDEASHGWEATQDTSITIADTQSRLLRALVNATGDPGATAYTLRVQKNGSGGYVAVPVGSASSPTLSWGAVGTISVSATNPTPTYPTGITTNSCLVLVVGQKPATANGGGVTTPSGWTLQGSLEEAGGYGATLAADTGNTNVFVYTKDAVTGSETGTLTVTTSDNNVAWANIYRIEASDIASWSYAFGSGEDTSAGNVSIATSAGVVITAGDHILAGMVIPTDVTTPGQFSAESLTQTSTTFGTVTEREEPDSNTGNDIGGFIVEAGVSSGGASGAVTLAATAGGTTTNVRGPGFVLRVRASAVNHEAYITTSANIAAGGEATTARLTAPSGKTTGDFVTGRRWDNENGTDTIDITTDDYTEVEWLVALSATPANDDFFDFRVYAGSTALTTYSVTPRWTIPGAGGGGAMLMRRRRN